MAIKNIIVYGFGFTPATTRWIPTFGFSLVEESVGDKGIELGIAQFFSIYEAKAEN